ncbi:MAG: twin-arginine translocase subunit TatC [Candidatus Altiarchaeota archaeon]|nr:twin-arginine translocase subunit TatC [Candidatus Altiarchaeota archaeon]
MEGKDFSVLEHLEELRRRVLVSLAVVVFAAIFCYPLSGLVLSFMQDSLFFGQNIVSFVVISPLEAVSVKVKASLLMAFTITSPVIFYEFWAFVGPALSIKEKRMLAYAFIPALLLFLTGVSFAYLILLPLSFSFLISEAAPLATPMLSLSETFDFMLFVLFSTGVSFELPLVIGVLTKVGLIDHKVLSAYRRHVIVLVFLAAGIVTPDPTLFSQVILAVPLVLLYEAGVLVSRLVK